jgi:RNA polymerase sigma factor (sigma-70 family)
VTDDYLPPPGENAPDEEEGSDPGEDAVRRRMVEEVLVSEELRNAIEVLAFRRGFRWNELLAETEDVRGEVATRALACLEEFDPRRGRPLAWLLAIATNVLRERARWYSRQVQRFTSQSSLAEAHWQEILGRLRTGPHAAADPEPVWQALARLGPEQQRILRMRFVEERRYAVIAHVLGISETAARARACRALRALRDQLQDLERREGE